MLLALCLLGGASALAADTQVTQDGKSGNTTVTYEILENKAFCVTIPASATIDPQTNEGSMVFRIEAPNFNAKGWGVSVNLTNSTGNFNLKNGDKAIPYKLKDSNGYELGLWNGVIEWNCDGVSSGAEATVTLEALPGNASGFIEAGEYSDTLTFMVYLLEPTTK